MSVSFQELLLSVKLRAKNAPKLFLLESLEFHSPWDWTQSLERCKKMTRMRCLLLSTIQECSTWRQEQRITITNNSEDGVRHSVFWKIIFLHYHKNSWNHAQETSYFHQMSSWLERNRFDKPTGNIIINPQQEASNKSFQKRMNEQSDEARRGKKFWPSSLQTKRWREKLS